MIFGPCISFLSLSSRLLTSSSSFPHSAPLATYYLSAFTLVGTMSNYKYPAMYIEKEAAERNAKKAQKKKESRARTAAQQQRDMLELAQRRAADANKCKFGTSPLCTCTPFCISYLLFGPSLFRLVMMPFPSNNAYQPVGFPSTTPSSQSQWCASGTVPMPANNCKRPKSDRCTIALLSAAAS